jgi:hypothetical protein
MDTKRAKYIKEELLSQMKHRLSGRQADELFAVYNTEVNPGRYKVAPCTCDANPWKQMIAETTTFVDRIIDAWEQKKKK